MALLTVVGSSDAFNSAGRAHSCYLLEGDGFGPVMIDFGATALQALRRVGREPRDLAGVALTHLHGDHIGGLPFLVIDAMYNSPRTAPLDILGPKGATARIEKVLEAAYGGMTDKEKDFELRLREIRAGEHAILCGVTVSGYPADHMEPPDEPLCLRVRLPGGGIVSFSGDTAMCQGLLDAADGADILVAECSALAPPCGKHTSWEDWRRMLPHVRARRIVLTHLGHEVRAKQEELKREAPPDIDLYFADDGLTFAL